MRRYLARLEKMGELNTINEEIHWHLQAAALGAMSNRLGDKAIHFKKIKGYPEGYSMATSLLTGPGTLYTRDRLPWTRQAIAMELDRSLAYNKYSYTEFLGVIKERLASPLPVTQVKVGPCKEEIHMGEEVDLFNYPFPFIHADDAARYSSFHGITAKDPESGMQEWGFSRVMLKDYRTLIGAFLPNEPSLITIIGENIWKIYQKYEKANKPMPICICLGVPPTLYMASLFFLPEGTDKASIAGGFRLEPIEMVKAETSDLLVPSTAEIIIEGEVLPHERATEGPYGEKTAGYSDPYPQPVIHVKAITNRKNPILPFTVDGAKVSDFMAVVSITASFELIRIIRLHANLFVHWLNLPVEWGLTTAVGSIKPLFPGFPYQIAATVFSSRAGRLIDKLILVDEDVPPMEMTYVYWDFIEKNHPDRGIVIWEGMDASLSPLVAYTTEEDKKRGTGSKVLFDCTFPTTWPKEDIPGRLSFEHFPEEIRKQVIERWQKLGIKPDPQTIGR